MAQDESTRSTIDLRRIRVQFEQTVRTEQERRRAEDRIREELRDSRAKVIKARPLKGGAPSG